MQPIAKILPSILETVSSLELEPAPLPAKSSSATKSGLPPSAPPEKPLKGFPPLPDPWQAKWLQLRNTHPAILEASNAVHAFGFDWFKRKRARRLVLAGRSGCGKTQLAKALYTWATSASMLAYQKRFWPSPPGVGFLLWQEVCDRLEDSRSSMVELLADAVAEPLLLVDDIGAESDRFKSGKGVDALGYLLTRRQDSGFTMLTTNIPPDEWHSRWDERVRDRLLRESTVVDMSECPSWSAL